MLSFVPHRNNPNIFRRIIGAIALIILSALTAYGVQKYISRSQIKVQAQQIETSSVTQNAGIELATKTPEQTEQQVSDNKNFPTTTIADSPQLGTSLEEAQAPVLTGPRSKDPKIALTEAKTYARPQITQGKYIDISLSHQNMILYEDGKFLDAYLISSGKASMPTPPGTYHIQNKVPRAYSKEFGLYMPWWMALVPSGSFGIHELPEWPGGYKEGANHLGIPVSHGCVRLGVGPAKRVYDWADIGTTVIVHK